MLCDRQRRRTFRLQTLVEVGPLGLSLIRRSPRLPLSYLESRCTVPSTARRTCPCLGCSSLFFDDDIFGQHLISEQ
jgi:hypothetical protein